MLMDCRVLLFALAALPSAAAKPLANVASCAIEDRLPPIKGQLCAVDHPARLMLCSSPKAAATTLSAVMIGFANASAEFHRWMSHNDYGAGNMLSARANYFRRQILGSRPAHAVPTDKLEMCAQAGWLCIFLVRNPRDRVISSFLHAAITKLGASWPELIETVGDLERVRVGNYSLRQHVDALELTRANIRNKQNLKHNGRRGGGADHYLPQMAEWLVELFHPNDDMPHYPASLVKFVTVDNVPEGLGAADDEYRGGKLGLRTIAEGLHSVHWRSSQASSLSRDADVVSTAQLWTGSAAPRIRVARGANERSGTSRAQGRRLDIRATSLAEGVISTETRAAELCGSPQGLTPRGAKRALAADGHSSGIKVRSSSGCQLLPNAYARLQAVDDHLWRRIRCLFHEDFELYEKRVCNQPWLHSRCPSCVAKACSSSSSSTITTTTVTGPAAVGGDH